MFDFFITNWWIWILLILFFSSLYSVNQGYIAVVVMFGKYQRIARPGLNMKIPMSA